MNRQLLILMEKEFKQVFRNKAMRPMLFVIPFLQLIILGNAATFEVNTIDVAVVDYAVTKNSRELIQKVEALDEIQLTHWKTADGEPAQMLVDNVADIVMIIPQDFSEDLTTGGANVQLLVDAVDGNAAQIGASFLREIITDFGYQQVSIQQSGGVQLTSRYLFNPELKYTHFMVPGILVLLITLIGVFLTSMNIVREREVGTIDQLNVTPISKSVFILGKLIPFGIIGLGELTIGLAIAYVLFSIPIFGGLLIIYGVSVIYLIGVLALGLLISTVSGTMQQALFSSWFILVIFILMSGLFTPIESMPSWAQWITEFNPVTHFIEIIRRVILKDAGWDSVLDALVKLSGLSVMSAVAAVLSFKKGGD
ncbi:ABC transporter permease [Rhodohalobacter sp. 8-1]|uniref:ABC transporter permease n=1 Tax=Rhodohalobacter sp. 8-1 TaxID=3131972 RepID=UPI0030EF1126